MPRGDGTGPLGQGPKTGKGLGKCGSKRSNTTKTILDDVRQRLKRGNSQTDNRSLRGQGSGQGLGRGNKQN